MRWKIGFDHMISIKRFLMLSSKQRELCRRLESGRSRLFRMAFAWSHSADIAEDVVQETMIKALNNVDKIKNDVAMDSWLFRILSNCYIDYCRKQREQVDIESTTLVDLETPESVMHLNEMLATVRTAIANLPFKHRQVITLIDIENFSYAEVADIVEVPQGTIMSRLNRARQALKQDLNEQKWNEQEPDHNKNSALKIVR
jgi:RNA polymerase sigma-70 factor (ECF subfamily)